MSENKTNKITVFISDDHFIFRKGLIDVCTENNIEVVGDSGESVETLKHCLDKNADVLIIDLNMDTTNGTQTIEKILEKYPAARCLVYSMRESINTIRAAYELGVYGYVTKSQGPETIIEAIKVNSTGKKYYMEGIAEKILEFSTNGEKNPADILTKKEMQLFKLIATGSSNEEIAKIMNVSVKSVVNVTLIIRKKLNIRLTSFAWVARIYDLVDTEL